MYRDIEKAFCSIHSSLLPGLKLERPIFTTAHPVPGHERVKHVKGEIVKYVAIFSANLSLHKISLKII